MEELLSIYDKKSGVQTEDKIISTSLTMLPPLALIDAVIPHLEKLRFELVSLFTQAYALEYNQHKGSELVFANDQFVDDIRGVVAYRRGIKRSIEMANEDRSQASNPDADANSCCVM